MTVDEIITAARYRLNDNSAVEYSNNELMEYVNTAQQFINKFLMERDSGLIKDVVTLDTSSGSHALPSDFMAICYVKDSNGYLVRHRDPASADGTTEYFPGLYQWSSSGYYYIHGTDIYSNLDSIELCYYKMLDDNTATTDTIPLPDFFRNLLLEMVLIIAFNRNEFAVNIEELLMQQFSKAIISLIANYDFAYKENIGRVMPWKV